MTAYTGHIIDANSTGHPASRPSWQSDPIPFTNDAEAWLQTTALNGSLTNNRPISMPGNNYTGHVLSGFKDLFYNRIVVTPSIVDFGNVVSPQNVTVKLWNAYFTSVTMDATSQTGDSNVTVTGTLPPPNVTFTALEEKSFTASTDVNGVPQIDGAFTFEFTAPTEDVTITFVGNRLFTLPYWWNAGATETLEYMTTIFSSRNGTEQRSRLRKMPRQFFRASAYVDRTDLTRVDNLFYGWRKQNFGVPVWTETRSVTTAALTGDTVINVDTQYGDFRVGSFAMIWETPRQFDVFEVDAITANSITSNRPITNDYSSYAQVVPVRIGQLMQDPVRHTSGAQVRIDIQFQIIDNIEITPSTPAQTFNSEDVYLEEPLLQGDKLPDSYNVQTELIDFNTGPFQRYYGWTNPKIQRQMTKALDSRQEAWEFREWLSRRAGRLRPFYMPTFEQNIRLITTGALGATIIVENDEQLIASARDHIAILDKAGNWTFHTIDSVVASGDDIQMNFTASLAINSTDIELMCYMGLKRLNSDRIEIQWSANCVGEVNLAITEIEP